MAIQGSQLYAEAINKKIPLPEKYDEFSFHSYSTKPLPTEHLKAYEILQLRDQKFDEYFKDENF